MRKILFVLMFISLSFGAANAADESAAEKDTKTSNHAVYLLGNAGALIPSGIFDSAFTGGGVLGFQIFKLFAIEAAVQYQGWNHDGKSPLLVSYPLNAGVVDYKLYIMYQQDFNITKKIALIPSLGIAPLYSYHQSGSPYNCVGIAGKIGLRFAYSYFLGGVNVEYTMKNSYRSAVTVMFEAGVRFKF